MGHPARRLSIALCALCSGAAGPAAAQQPSFTGLGDLPGGSFFSQALGISADGSTVVGRSNSELGSEAFRWTEAEGILSLNDGAGSNFASAGNAASADGSAIVGSGSTARGSEAFRWTASDFLALGDLPGGDFSSAASGVSADGAVIVGNSRSQLAEFGEAFRWEDDGSCDLDASDPEVDDCIVGLGDLPGGDFQSLATGVSADGAVVVGFGRSDSNTFEAFRWTENEGMVGLGYLSATSRAHAVSADGSVIVGETFSETGVVAFRWEDDGSCDPDGSDPQVDDCMVSLGDLEFGTIAGDRSRAFAVSADGSVVVGVANDFLGDTAFVWDQANGMRKLGVVLADLGLSPPFLQLTEATAVSADGRTIAGWGTNFDQELEGWVTHLPEPEPAAQGLAALAALWLLARLRRRNTGGTRRIDR